MMQFRLIARGNYALTANGTQVYSGLLSGTSSHSKNDGINTAKELGLTVTKANGSELITRAQAVSIIHAAQKNKKSLPELPIVTEMKGVVEGLPQQQFNEFYASMKLIPESIRKDFISQGWKICFDVDRINEYSKRKNIYGLNGMTVYSEKVIYLADAGPLLHEMGHYYQKRIETSAWMSMYIRHSILFATLKNGVARYMRQDVRLVVLNSLPMPSSVMCDMVSLGLVLGIKIKKTSLRVNNILIISPQWDGLNEFSIPIPIQLLCSTGHREEQKEVLSRNSLLPNNKVRLVAHFYA